MPSVIILFMFALYISRYHSVRHTHFPRICIFFLLFLLKIFQKIHPKCASDCSISISKMQKLPRVGGGTHPRLLSTPRIFVDNLAPPPPPKNIPAQFMCVNCCTEQYSIYTICNFQTYFLSYKYPLK